MPHLLKDRTKGFVIAAGIVVFLLALVIRVQWLHTLENSMPLRGDAIVYATYAKNLAEKGVYSKDPGQNPVPDNYRSPGLPLLLAGAMALFGDPGYYKPALYTQALLGALTAVLTFLAGLFLLPLGGAFAAGLLVAVSPHHFALPGFLVTEPLFSFFLILGAVFLFNGCRRGTWPWFALAGSAWGLAYLVNETALFLPPFLAGAVWLLSERGKTRVEALPRRLLVVFLAVFFLFPTAWTLRNRLEVPKTAETGGTRALRSIAFGSYPEFKFNGARSWAWYDLDPEAAEFSSSFSGYFRILKRRFQKEPGRYLAWFLVQKPYYLWRWEFVQSPGFSIYALDRDLYSSSPAARAMGEGMEFVHGLVLLLALAFVPLTLVRAFLGREEVPALATALALLYFTALYMVFCPLPRYSVPVRPFLYLAAACALVAGLRFAGRRLAPPRPETPSRLSAAAIAALMAVSLGFAVLVVWETRQATFIRRPEAGQLDIPLRNYDYFCTTGERAFQRNRIKEARKLFSSALELKPDGVDARLGLGKVFLMQGRFGEAETELRKALALDLDSAAAFNGLSIAAAQEKDFSRAWALASKALRMRPGAPSIRNFRAHLRPFLERDYKNLTEAAPKDEPGEARLLEMGRMALALGEDRAALGHFLQAGKRNPGNPGWKTGQALCLIHLKEEEEAMQILDRVLKDRPDQASAKSLMALLSVRGGRPGEAESTLEKAVALGFADGELVLLEPGFDPLRESPVYRRLVLNYLNRP